MSPITYRTLQLRGDPDALGREQAALLQLTPPLRRPPWERDERFLPGCANIVADTAPPPHVDPLWAAQQVLADYEAPVCAHREFGATLWSGVFDLGARRAIYAFGPPCSTPFSEDYIL